MHKLLGVNLIVKQFHNGMEEAAAPDWVDQQAWKGGWIVTMFSTFALLLTLCYTGIQLGFTTGWLRTLTYVFSFPMASVLGSMLGTWFAYGTVGLMASQITKREWQKVTGRKFGYKNFADALADLAADIDVGMGKTAPQAAKDRFNRAHHLAYCLAACPADLKAYIALARDRRRA